MAQLKDLIVNGESTFIGVPKAPTAASGTNTTQVATTAFVQSAVNGSKGSVHYGYCTTAAATQAKTVTISTVTALAEGLRITVRFQYAQTYNGVPTLNVSNLGAKNILLRDSTNGVRYLWNAGAVLEFTYNGTGWVMENGGFADTTYYGITKLTTAYNSTNAATALTPLSLHNFAENSIASYYSTSATYAVGDIVRYSHSLYRCNTAITTAEAWTAAHWTQIIAKDYLDDEIFIATYGTTTLAEIGEAFNAGKAIFCSSTNILFPLNAYNGGNLAIFGAVQGTNANNMALTLFVNFADNWSTATANPVLKTGATMTGALIAQNNTDYTTAQTRNIILSTSEPTASDGGNGDIWLVYTA